MASPESRLRISNRDDVTVVEFLDRNILDEMNVQAIGEEIGSLVEQAERPRMLISFANVDHLTSAALGTLITVRNKVKAKNGELKLADIDPQIHEVFEITRLTGLFDIHPTSDDALGAFK
ncbi:MAG: anti-sigma factor antagonist [Planctomycetota bacterium]|nr:MAG: anti-sigma factor antagonist [Planctomycetota bacterium]